MVEVFKTNVNDPVHADTLLDEIHRLFSGYKANFDLEDCDKILRVASDAPSVQAHQLIDLLKELGCYAEVLPDDSPAVSLGPAQRD